MFTVPILSMIVAAVLACWLSIRTMRMGPAVWLALGLGLAGLILFGDLTRDGQVTAAWWTGFGIAVFILLPAALGALIGGVAASILAQWSGK